jgi:hypothetical protein
MSDDLGRFREVAEHMRRQEHNVRAMTGSGGGGPRDPSIYERVSHLEVDMKDVKSTLIRLEPLIINIHSQVPHLATKVEFATTKTDIERLRGDVMSTLASKPGRGDMWTMAVALFALVAGAMAAGAVFLPLSMKLWHVQS